MLVGVVGLIGSGKGTVADRLAQKHNFRKDSFAKSLKDAVSSMFNWDREMLEGKTDEHGENSPTHSGVKNLIKM
jgi:dephospho-CoA kinase